MLDEDFMSLKLTVIGKKHDDEVTRVVAKFQSRNASHSKKYIY